MHAAAPYCSPRVAARSGATSRAASPASQPRRLRLPPPRAVLDVTEADFDAQVLQSPVPVLVDFWATWCGPCKLMSVTVGQLDKEAAGKLRVVKIELDGNPELGKKYAVYGLPCIMAFSQGELIAGSKREGALTKAKLAEHLAACGVPVGGG